MDSDNSIVCTLFEGHYHYGLAALVNSLYSNGFRGDIYAGYRGDLPDWTKQPKVNSEIKWDGAITIEAAKGLKLHFLPVRTERHLANYKPAFMLSLQNCITKGLFYFDPDIVVKCSWEFFEEWIQYGVAVVQEIVSNHFSPNHPKRMLWHKLIKQSNRQVTKAQFFLFNSGFCGVSINNFEFVKVWEDIVQAAINHMSFDPKYFFGEEVKHNYILKSGDQDAFNIATMCCKSNISDIGPEGMDFIHGGWLMSHRTAQPKPWKINYLVSALHGKKISLSEKNYWKYVNLYLKTHSTFTTYRKKACIKIASLINRFYLKS